MFGNAKLKNILQSQDVWLKKRAKTLTMSLTCHIELHEDSYVTWRDYFNWIWHTPLKKITPNDALLLSMSFNPDLDSRNWVETMSALNSRMWNCVNWMLNHETLLYRKVSTIFLDGEKAFSLCHRLESKCRSLWEKLNTNHIFHSWNPLFKDKRFN